MLILLLKNTKNPSKWNKNIARSLQLLNFFLTRCKDQTGFRNRSVWSVLHVLWTGGRFGKQTLKQIEPKRTKFLPFIGPRANLALTTKRALIRPTPNFTCPSIWSGYGGVGFCVSYGWSWEFKLNKISKKSSNVIPPTGLNFRFYISEEKPNSTFAKNDATCMHNENVFCGVLPADHYHDLFDV